MSYKYNYRIHINSVYLHFGSEWPPSAPRMLQDDPEHPATSLPARLLYLAASQSLHNPGPLVYK